MTNRKEYLKNRYQELKEQTKKYKILLEQGLVEILNYNELRVCKQCRVSKALGECYYLKLILFLDSKYKGEYETTCIECVLQKQKLNGKLFNEKLFEQTTGT